MFPTICKTNVHPCSEEPISLEVDLDQSLINQEIQYLQDQYSASLPDDFNDFIKADNNIVFSELLLEEITVDNLKQENHPEIYLLSDDNHVDDDDLIVPTVITKKIEAVLYVEI